MRGLMPAQGLTQSMWAFSRMRGAPATVPLKSATRLPAVPFRALAACMSSVTLPPNSSSRFFSRSATSRSPREGQGMLISSKKSSSTRCLLMFNENYLLYVILLTYGFFHNVNNANYYFTLFSFLCNIYFFLTVLQEKPGVILRTGSGVSFMVMVQDSLL